VSTVPSYTLKFHRAMDLYDLILEHSAEFVKEKITYTAEPEMAGTDEWDVLRWDEPPESDPLLGVIVGELVHDLRSALDHLVYDLIKDNDEDPGTHSQFPIYDNESQWVDDIEDRDPTRKPSPVLGVSADELAVIKAAQPLHLKGKKRPRHPLMQLHRMSNVDKHRAIHIVSVSANAPTIITYEPPGFVAAMKIKYNKPGVLVAAGTEAARVKRHVIRIPHDGTEVIVRMVGRAQFAFGEPGKPPIATLTEVGQIIESVRGLILGLRPGADLSVLGRPPE